MLCLSIPILVVSVLQVGGEAASRPIASCLQRYIVRNTSSQISSIPFHSWVVRAAVVLSLECGSRVFGPVMRCGNYFTAVLCAEADR